MNNRLIVSRFDALYAERQSSVDAIWTDIERFVLPLRGEFYEANSSENQVGWDRHDIYDSTAITACQSLAASMQSNITAFSQQWFDLKFSDDELNSDDAAMEWLEATGKVIYDALVESNFDVEIAEAYLDLAAYGTSVFTEEAEEDDLIFTAVPLRDCVFEENAKKQVHTFYRRLYMTPLQMIDKFGEDGVPQKILDKKDASDAGTSKDEVIFVIYPRKDNAEVDLTKPLAEKMRPYGYKYVLKAGAQLVGEEGGYYEMPSHVTRWAKTGGSKWGHSPAMNCIADIRTLNMVKEATLEAAGKAIDPANITENANIIGDLDLSRGGLTVLADIDGLRPYESGTKFDVSNMEIGMLTESIRKAFFQDQLELKESPQMTATEVNVRYELMQRLLGPVVARLKTDLLDPIIQTTFNILYRRGDIPEVPEGMGANINIEYNGILPRSQRADTVQSMQRYVQSLAELAEVFPQMLEIVDTDAMARELAMLGGVPAKVLKSQEEMDMERQAQQQQQQQMQQMEQAGMAGQSMQALGDGMQSLKAVEQ